MAPVRLFDARTLRQNEKLKSATTNKNSKTSTIQPPESSDLHFVHVDRKLRDRSSEQIVLCMAAKCERQRELEKKLNRSFSQETEAQSIGIGLWDGP